MFVDEVRVPVRFRLSALWCAVMFCYLYGDYFELYQTGKLPAMLAGRTGIGPATQGALLGMSVMMAIPSLMVFLSLVLPVRISRWANILLGVAYSAIVVLAIQGGWHFYVFMGLIEIALTLTIVFTAWTWPKAPAAVRQAVPLREEVE